MFQNDTNPLKKILLLRINLSSYFVNIFTAILPFFSITTRVYLHVLSISTINYFISGCSENRYQLSFTKIYDIFIFERTVPL